MNAQQFQKVNAQISSLTKGWLISAIGGLVALLSMIMPWAVINLGTIDTKGFTFSASGFSIMAINAGTLLMQLLNLAALVAIIVFFVLYLRKKQLDKIGTLVVFILGIFCVLMTIVVYAIAAGAATGTANLGFGQMGLAPGLGFFIGLAGFIALAVGGVLNFLEFKKLHPEAFAPRPAYPYAYPPQQPGQYPPQQPQAPQQYPPQQPPQQYPPQQYPPQGQYPQYPQQGQYPQYPQQPPQYPQPPKEPPKP